MAVVDVETAAVVNSVVTAASETEVVFFVISVTVIVGYVSFSVFSGSAYTVIESIKVEIIPDNIKYFIFIVLLNPP